MQELLVDFITSLDGYGAAEGWPGWWGLEGPEYLAWLGQQPEHDYTILMGANTYRLMSGFATESKASASEEPMTDEGADIAHSFKATRVLDFQNKVKRGDRAHSGNLFQPGRLWIFAPSQSNDFPV